jgi:hypothetical protein
MPERFVFSRIPIRTAIVWQRLAYEVAHETADDLAQRLDPVPQSTESHRHIANCE